MTRTVIFSNQETKKIMEHNKSGLSKMHKTLKRDKAEDRHGMGKSPFVASGQATDQAHSLMATTAKG